MKAAKMPRSMYFIYKLSRFLQHENFIAISSLVHAFIIFSAACKNRQQCINAKPPELPYSN